jgi:two-component system response regulator AtoC
MSSTHRILVVEDECTLAHNLKSFLARRSPDVRIAPNGEQALEMLGTFTPDVAVIDYGLPRMNGVETYHEIVRRHAQPIGCVMITGYPLEQIAPIANKQGIRHFLCKPFSLLELQQMVDLSAEEAARASH